MTLLRSLLFGVFFYGGIVVLGTLYLPLLILPRKVGMPFFLFFVDYSMACMRFLTGMTYRVHMAEGARLPDGPAIYAAKHQSAWETIAFNRVIPGAVFVLKRELLRVPFFGWYLWKAGHIAVDRSAGASAMRAMVSAGKDVIDRGGNIVIYPQGTRVAPGVEAPYHPGVFALYKALNLPVVPVALDSGRLWRRNGVIKRAGVVTVSILPTIEPGLDRKSFMERLELSIEAEVMRLDRSNGGDPR